MKAKELKKFDIEVLGKKLLDAKEDHFNLRFQHGRGQLENQKALKRSRKDIARIMTVIKERQKVSTVPPK